MKRIISSIGLLMFCMILFSCSEDNTPDNGKEFISETFELKASLNVAKEGDPTEESVLTKANNDEGSGAEMPTNAYPLDIVYLMVPRGNNWEAFPIYKSTPAKYISEFDLTVSTNADGTVNLRSATGEAMNVPCNVNLYLSSAPRSTVRANVNTNKKTPAGENTYDPYGKHLYKSIFFKITVSNGQIKMFNKTLIAGNTTPLGLVMYRLTGLYTAHVIFYRKNNFTDDLLPSGQTDPPLGIKDEDWTSPPPAGFGYDPIADWTVTPYLTNYPVEFFMSENDMTGLPNYGGDIGYVMLANGPLKFKRNFVGVKVDNYNAFTISTYYAQSDNEPFVFNGTFGRTECQMKYVIRNKDLIVGIVNVNLAGNVNPNDMKSLWVSVNAASLDGRHELRSVPLDDVKENEIPASFFWWE